MTLQNPLSKAELREGVTVAIAGHWKFFLIQGLLLELLGVLAFTMPLWSTLAVDILIGWLFFVGGIGRTVTLVRAKHLPGYWWALTSAILRWSLVFCWS